MIAGRGQGVSFLTPTPAGMCKGGRGIWNTLLLTPLSHLDMLLEGGMCYGIKYLQGLFLKWLLEWKI